MWVHSSLNMKQELLSPRGQESCYGLRERASAKVVSTAVQKHDQIGYADISILIIP